ncbi:hypothetical protein ACLKA6_018437 [Drosophila palustris]
MQLVNILCIGLLTVVSTHGLDICTNQTFGYRAVDSENPQTYYLCLGLLGKIKNTCSDGYLFSNSEQRCVLDKQSKAIGFPRADATDGPKNVFNINQNISMYKPIIFNIFGSFWKPSPPLPLPITTTEAPVTPTEESTEKFLIFFDRRFLFLDYG